MSTTDPPTNFDDALREIGRIATDAADRRTVYMDGDGILRVEARE